MGIFNLFKSSSAPRNDMVWQTHEAKLEGCLKMLTAKPVDICLAWFEDTRDKFDRFLNTEHQRDIKIVMAKSLFNDYLDNKSVLFLEHYPLYSKEANLLAGKNVHEVWFLSSLGDPIFKLFGDNLLSLMQKLGMGENECIEHNMVSKSILNAQKKLEKEVWSDFSATSGDDWLRQFRSKAKKAF